MTEPDYLHHRQRLKQRLMLSRPGELPDYEIMELVLFLANPRQDLKPLAKQLIKTYGSVARVLMVAPEELKQIKGIKDSAIHVLRIIKEASLRLIKDDLDKKPIIECWKTLLDYCKATMGHLKTEQFRILFLDNKNMVIEDMLQEYGTVDQVVIHPRELVKKALILNAASIIMVHNHPSGKPKPSKADIEMTREIHQALKLIDVALHDHLIISSGGYYSFKAQGMI